MDHEQRRQRQHRSRRSGSGGGGASSSSRKQKGGGGKKPIKVVYISNPMHVKTSAAGFRALVQELTGRHADPSKYSPEDPGAATAVADLDCGAAQGLSPREAAASTETIVASPAAAEHLPDTAPQDGDYYDDEEDEGGFGSLLLANSYSAFSPPTLLYNQHPQSKLPFG